jgi:hypothetical protein
MTLDADVKGDAYEGLLAKNAEDVKSGAGQLGREYGIGGEGGIRTHGGYQPHRFSRAIVVVTHSARLGRAGLS